MTTRSEHGQPTAPTGPGDAPRHTNALSRETSPYLLQHAHNPVDWHAWGPEALDLARKLDRPIFLSIGYSTCYWCHVMERQCFENEAIAAVMNAGFVNIKVDREERPDVDDIYMLAVQMMTGSGGWPMNVFLTPPGAGGSGDRGLKPFYAGTYFPPEPMHGRPGFPQVLQAISQAWKSRRAEALAQADKIADGVSEHLGSVEEEGELSLDLVSTAANRLLRSYDPEHGGFGGAPKFPTPSNLFFLMGVHAGSPHQDVWNALANTFDRMARGGMYDQVGGGFHRYTTDERWLVPHFEKMLYDNGQLVEAYLAAQAIEPDPFEPGLYPRIVRQTCDYVIREMTDATGAYWSAQDAEVDTFEGGNYLWNPSQIAAAIPDAKLAGLAVRMYGLDAGPNFRDPHHPHAAAANVLFLPRRLDELARDERIKLDEILEAKQKIDGLLLAARSGRKQPGTDDKVLVAWNGMMIAGMARAGSDLHEPRYTASAARAARAIMGRMRASDGGLLRTMRGGVARIPAFLDDYAFFVHGLIGLHRADHDPAWLAAAAELMQIAHDRFNAGAGRGGYFDTLADQPDLFVRTRTVYDGAIPSANSQMVHNLLDLHELTGEAAPLERAIADLASFADALRRNASGMARMQQALLRAAALAPDRFKPASVLPAPGGKRPVLSLELDPGRVTPAGGNAVVNLTLRIGPDYHLNSHEPGVEGLIPTTLSLRGDPGLTLEVDYPTGKSKRYPFADRPLAVYEGVVTLRATLHKTAAAAAFPEQTVLVLRYQVCTDTSCLEPQEREIPLKIG